MYFEIKFFICEIVFKEVDVVVVKFFIIKSIVNVII